MARPALALALLVLLSGWLAAPTSAQVHPQVAKAIRPLRHRFAITYANLFHTDGAGAQLHRTYGIYCLTRYLKVQYYHSGIGKLDYQGLQALEENHEITGLVQRYNDVFHIDSDVQNITGWELYDRDPKLSYGGLFTMLQRLEANPDLKILYAVVYPFEMAEANPGKVFAPMASISPFRNHPRDKSLCRIAIHVRRGDEMLRVSDRMLPNSYYVNLSHQIARILEDMNVPYAFELFTEVPKNVTVITPQHHDMQRHDFHLEKNVVLDPTQNAVEEFDAIPNLIKAFNADQIYALERFATANMLIMSRSSFSYSGAIHNTEGLIFNYKFWHTGLPHWIGLTGTGAEPFTPEIDRHIRDWVLQKYPRWAKWEAPHGK